MAKAKTPISAIKVTATAIPLRLSLSSERPTPITASISLTSGYGSSKPLVAACDVVSSAINPSTAAILAISLLPVEQICFSVAGTAVASTSSQEVEINVLPAETTGTKTPSLICQQAIRTKLPVWTAEVITLRLMEIEGASKLA